MATNNMPWGDAFLVQTPTLDRWSQQLYQEQKIRQAKQQQENAALDAQIQKELGKVRSVDTPEVIRAYQNYKTLKQNLLFNKQLQKDPLAYNQAQQAADKSYQDIFSLANQSSELKDMSKNLTTDRIKNPNAYADDFGERMNALMNTPISGLQQNPDLTNWDKYMYSGPDVDMAKIVRDAAGQPRRMAGKTVTLPGGLQTSTPVYEYGNTPAQVKDNILGAYAVHKAGRAADYTWDHTPKSEIEDTIAQYQAIPKEDWEKMGLQEPQDILPKNPDNKAENLASLQAMKYFIANRPRLVENKIQENKQAVLDWQLNKDKIMEGIRHGNRMAEISFRDELKDKNNEEQDDMMDELYDNLKSAALKSPKRYKPSGSQPFNQYEIKTTEGVKKLFAVKNSKGHEVYPDAIRFSKDFNQVFPIFLEHYYDDKGNMLPDIKKDENGNAKVEEDLSKPILEEEFKQRWKKELMGAQAYGKTLKNKKASSKHNPKDPLGIF